MSVMQIQKMEFANLAAEEYFLASEKLIQGNPKQTIWQHYTDPSAKFLTGIWQSEIGKWRINYTEEEFCQMLQGVSILTDADGREVTLKAGDNFVIPRGFQGTWEVLELSRKIYVIYEA
ncbi:cupin domain-containing protein [Undibacterium parvum]|uniref:Cupin domain-containing protein n=1 Tax=Undibacterium parvum TaxID=401471 RepID=A0A3Q9BU34_9BURK|nr:cupin domain-containing protein [Undibacterium parvum]AZP13937.1 cupin domain-containing protein [Undibacterium parvum]